MLAYLGLSQRPSQSARVMSLLLVLLLVQCPAYALTASEIFESAAQSTVLVRNLDAKGDQQSIGSGVVLPQGDIVTNCHVIKDASQLTVRVGGNQRAATLLQADIKRDLCVLRSPDLIAPAAKVGSSDNLKVGAKVYAIGAPSGLELTMSDGIVSNLREFDSGKHIQITAAISRGSSGGGLYDENGALVGLTSFYLAEGQSLNFAIPIDWVNDLLGRKITNTHAPSAVTHPANTNVVSTPAVAEQGDDWYAQMLLLQSKPWLKTFVNTD